MTGRHRHPRHAVTWILLGLPVLVAADAGLWVLWLAWHALPVLLPAAAFAYGCRRWAWHRRAWAALTRSRAQRPGRVLHGQVIDSPALDAAELERLRSQVTRLEHAANRPIDAIAANYERIGRQYGPAATGRNGQRP
jgi:hypothetical protein